MTASHDCGRRRVKGEYQAKREWPPSKARRVESFHLFAILRRPQSSTRRVARERRGHEAKLAATGTAAVPSGVG